MMFRASVLSMMALALWACGDAALEVEEVEFDASGLAVRGVPSNFDRDNIMSDALFEGREVGPTASQVQSFFERTPYGRRSWLADERIGGRLVSEALHEAGERWRVNPLVILVRMQAEQGLVSATSRPNQRRRDWAFGCGCPDNRACDEQYRGLDKQLECAAKFLRVNYDRSAQREGNYFHVGKSKRTLDGFTVRPDNHATAAHYNYTPHAGSRSNQTGAYLTWVIMRKYAGFVEQMGPSRPSLFIGDACTQDDACTFSGGACMDTEVGGMCTQSCAGTCPDQSGKAPTFCVSLDGGLSGTCVQQAHTRNDFCHRLPGTERRTMDRHIGSSSSSARTRDVCAPVLAAPRPDPIPEPRPEPMPAPEPIFTPDANPWVGSLCQQDSHCGFSSGGERGACQALPQDGMCVMSCEGYCPDKSGKATTFCVSLDGGRSGACLPRAHSLNSNCADIPGTLALELDRHIGRSGASRASRTVCFPETRL